MSLNIGTLWLRRFAAAVVLSLVTAGAATASITSVVSTDNSSAVGTPIWEHQTSVSPVTTAANTASFTHTVQLLNSATHTGGVAQLHSRNSVFELAFTVEDPTNSGFTLDIDQLLRGYSTVTVEAGRGDATGLLYFVRADDSTDAPGTLSTRTDLFLSTGGVTGVVDTGEPTLTVSDYFSDDSSVTFGSYVGTTDFLLDFTSLLSPTTNVFFQNGSVGSGSVNYGLGTLPPGSPFTPADLGHFMTITATFESVPEPSSLTTMAVLSLIGIGYRR